MRELQFPAYTEDDELPPQIFLAVYYALMEYVPGKERKAAKNLERLLDDFDALKEPREDEPDPKAFRLLRGGATVALEDEKFDILKKAWETHAGNIPGRFVRVRNATDDLLEAAPHYTEKEWAKLLVERGMADEPEVSAEQAA